MEGSLKDQHELMRDMITVSYYSVVGPSNMLFLAG